MQTLSDFTGDDEGAMGAVAPISRYIWHDVLYTLIDILP